MLSTASTAPSQAVLYVNVNGTWTQLAATAVRSGSGTLKLVVKGSSLKLTFGATTLTATDGQLTTGTEGLRGGRHHLRQLQRSPPPAG